MASDGSRRSASVPLRSAAVPTVTSPDSWPRYAGDRVLTMTDHPGTVPGVTRSFNDFERFQAEIAELEFKMHRAFVGGDPAALSHYWELQTMYGRVPTEVDLTGSYGTAERSNFLFAEICKRVNLRRRAQPPPRPPSWLNSPNDRMTNDEVHGDDMLAPDDERAAPDDRRDDDDMQAPDGREDETLTDYLTKKRRIVIERDVHGDPICLHARTIQHLHGVEQNRSYVVTVVKSNGDPRACVSRLYDTKRAAKYAYSRMHNLGYCCTWGCVLLPDDISGWSDSDEGEAERKMTDEQFANMWDCGPNGLFCVQNYRSAAAASTDTRG